MHRHVERATKSGILWLALLCGFSLMASPVLPLDLQLPGNGQLSKQVIRNPDSYLLPVGPWSNGDLPTLEVEGRIVQQAWRIEADGVTTLQLMDSLLKQLADDGFDTLFECYGNNCGGFDFRFGTKVMSAPDMFVDLFDYRFLSARAPGPEYVSIFVSKSGPTGYVQIIHAAPEAVEPPQVSPNGAARPVARPGEDSTITPAASTQSIGQSLMSRGRVVLDDLEFDTGSSNLGPGPYPSLQLLADFLKSDDKHRVALVGHTDTVGGLDGNIALSKRRAASVVSRLTETYEVAKSQLEAGGMGYLSPVASNLTPEGRELNRRVEAVLLNVE